MMTLCGDQWRGDPVGPWLTCVCVCVCLVGRKRSSRTLGIEASSHAAWLSLAVYPSALPPGRHKQSVFQLSPNHWKMGLVFAKEGWMVHDG